MESNKLDLNLLQKINDNRQETESEIKWAKKLVSNKIPETLGSFKNNIQIDR